MQQFRVSARCKSMFACITSMFIAREHTLTHGQLHSLLRRLSAAGCSRVFSRTLYAAAFCARVVPEQLSAGVGEQQRTHITGSRSRVCVLCAVCVIHKHTNTHIPYFQASGSRFGNERKVSAVYIKRYSSSSSSSVCTSAIRVCMCASARACVNIICCELHSRPKHTNALISNNSRILLPL